IDDLVEHYLLEHDGDINGF
ncbi:hypothetical protein AAA799P11_01528, partial [Marine Group I thaumarchaeote SCGC AAA799-P11]